MAIRTHVMRKPYGDQGIFLQRSVFEELGGYPNSWKLLEDVKLVEKLSKGYGRPEIIPRSLETSGRRWKKLGLIKTTVVNQMILLGYALGFDNDRLANFYKCQYNNE